MKKREAEGQRMRETQRRKRRKKETDRGDKGTRAAL